MIFGLFGKKNNNQAILLKQYQALTDAARQEGFYTGMDVPDTVMGRFEMLSAVLILYFRRMSGATDRGKLLAQDIVDAFFEDVDHSIRELGVGDLSVPKRMKKLAGMFYGRVETYTAALEKQDVAELAAALKRNFHPKEVDTAPDMLALAHYLMRASQFLADQPDNDAEAGLLLMPSPTTP